MTGPSITLSISRTGMPGALSPLVASGVDDDAFLGLTAYRDVAVRTVVAYSPGSRRRPGIPLSWTYQEGVMAWEFITDRATSEAEAQSAFDQVVAAVGRLVYPVTVVKNGGDAQVWSCRAGSVEPADDLDYPDLRDFEYAYSVTIPCYPVRS